MPKLTNKESKKSKQTKSILSRTQAVTQRRRLCTYRILMQFKTETPEWFIKPRLGPAARLWLRIKWETEYQIDSGALVNMLSYKDFSSIMQKKKVKL